MTEIIEIKDLKNAIPRKNTWYKYYDNIFISVLGETNRRYHIRYKNDERISKTDSINNEWHINWQYHIIEAKYGLNTNNPKTFEISVNHQNERHRIDSLVNNIAIEFQHTLTVSIDEMNSRYIAHKANGFLPYLILDLTETHHFNKIFRKVSKQINEQHNCYNNDLYDFELEQKVFNQIFDNLKSEFTKWFKTEYYINDNLFLDFEDKMIRLTKQSFIKYLVFDKVVFINQLLDSEKYTYNICENEITRLNENKRNKQIDLQEKELAKQKAIDLEKELNKNKKLNSSEFKHYRTYLNDSEIKKVFPNVETENIEYISFPSETNGEFTIKKHYYQSKESPFKLISTTKSEINKAKGYKFISADVIIKRYFKNEVQKFTFEKNKKSTIIKERRIELYNGFLHSTSYTALRTYEDGKIKTDKYFLFNTEIPNKNDWKSLCNYFSPFCELHYEPASENKFSSIINQIEKNDELNLRQIFIEYNGKLPDWKIMELNIDTNRAGNTID